MTVPLWCLAFAAILPYFFPPFSLAERKARFGEVDLHQPRTQAAGLTDRGARAMGAHFNAFEALGVFTVAVLVAHVVGANATHSAILAVAWVGFRLMHGVFYLRDVPALRTASFAGALFCAIGLLGVAVSA